MFLSSISEILWQSAANSTDQNNNDNSNNNNTGNSQAQHQSQQSRGLPPSHPYSASSRQTPSASTPQQHRQGLERAGSTPNAGNSYRIPTGFDLQQGRSQAHHDQGGRASTDAASGLPWGGVGLEHIIDAGHEAERKRRSKSA